MRVVVPVGRRTMTGCVVEVYDVGVTPDLPSGLKPIVRTLDEAPLVPANTLSLALWVADYYMSGPGEAIALTLPPTARTRADGFKQRRLASLTDAGRASLGGGARLTDSQRRLLEYLATRTDPVPVADLASAAAPGVLSRLVARGLATVQHQRVERDPFLADAARETVDDEPSPLAIPLTREQAEALDRLQALARRGGFAVSLLHGVTGSGKTQVYLRLADAVLARGKAVLLLVPEIALTSAMARLVTRAFGARVAVQHSGLSAGERHDQWQRIRRGEVDVVVGTRSAVFAPLANVGLIVVDEEHDTSYKQDESPRYHGRDVAIVRGRAAAALVVLGSATPSMESHQHARTGRYALVTLERRVLDRPLASVVLVNMRDVFAEEGPDVVLSAVLRRALSARLEAGEQSVVLLNRRGYAVALFCRQCAATLECPNCSITLTVHRSASVARCHYCDYGRRVPDRCPVVCGRVSRLSRRRYRAHRRRHQGAAA